MIGLNRGVFITLAVCAATQALGLSYLPKQQGRPAVQRRRLRKHKNEVVQLPKTKTGERRKGSKKNSYQPDQREYPAYLSGFYVNDGQIADTRGEDTQIPGTNEPTYSPTYDYYSAQPGNAKDKGNANDNGNTGYYYIDQPKGYPYEEVAQPSVEPQPQPQPYYSKGDKYSAKEVVYTYTGEPNKQAKKGTKEAKVATKDSKEAKTAGKKSANKGLPTKYKAVKGDKSKGKKGSYYVYGVEEDIQPDDIIVDEEHAHAGETYESVYDQSSGKPQDGLLDPLPDNDDEGPQGSSAGQIYPPTAKTSVPEEYYVLPPKGSKSKKENSRSKSTVFGGNYNPATKGLKGEQLHTRSKSSSCKGKGKGNDVDDLYDPEALGYEAGATDECTTDSKKLSKKKSSGKKSKSKGKSMLILRKFSADKLQ